MAGLKACATYRYLRAEGLRYVPLHQPAASLNRIDKIPDDR
jgi:hypothetical protein